MIAYIEGKITHKTPTYVYIDTGGVGYHINISLHTHSQLEGKDSIKLWTHFHVKEDQQTLYGFCQMDERSMFVHLISVSGIGPNTARLVLSSLTPAEAKSAIVNDAVAVFNKVKGVGPKTAKRIILDLKDKLMKEGDPITLTHSLGNNTVHQEALSALVSLGFQRNAVQKLINKIYNPGMTVEELVKQTLKAASK